MKKPGRNRTKNNILTGGNKKMQILATNIANLKESKKTLYRMTVSGGLNVQKLSPDQLSQSYPVDVYVLYQDTNEKGEEHQILSIWTGKEKLSTISQTFIKSFMKIVSLMEDDPFNIIIMTGESKNGRKYVDCELDCSI